MALGSALVDRARTVRHRKVNTRVQGTRQYTTDRGTWFRCRITIPKGEETHEDGRHKRRSQPTMIIAKRDVRGEFIDVNAWDEIEVDSREFGTVTYQVAGDLEPLRKRRTVIGWSCAITKTEAKPDAA